MGQSTEEIYTVLVQNLYQLFFKIFLGEQFKALFYKN